ncbi:ElyC/SanA/YdcF family protein [Halomonas icarae]|uniref:DUF218 domain-containing protein n=1 Tax=Halomonas icarae TaxID=2691040 RepID=A0A7X4VWS3_9GAMM|nr:ElyC/SanA/YdcF family protein [Halomonas icarae]MDR5903036.1 ElyC/SanA/YdcF family protein [Halomonas icarae]NAW11592.1 hypothetical protein [Halomonas icarae]
MYDLLKTLAAQLAMPLPITLGLLLVGLLLCLWGWRRMGMAAAAAGLGLLLLASWGPVAERLLAPLEAEYAPMPALVADVEAVVVLGGGWQPEAPRSITGKLGESSAIRLMEGVRLWRQRPELPLVVTGASRDPSQAPVARGYARAARALGVPSSRLRVLDTPTDTGQEASAVREALGEGARVVLVTSASHMPRAMAHFRAVGLAPVAAPTHYLANGEPAESVADWVPSASHLRKTERALYEAMGRWALRFEGP